MRIDFGKNEGRIKAMHAINNAPILGADDRMFHYLTGAGIPYSRLHDTGGAYGGGRFVDITNIFRNFDADENDPESYDFAFTDWLLNALTNHEVEPFYRLGVTIENYQHIKAYNIYPPKSFAKWARICEKVIAHYNEGWADGYHLGIKYWEIWNEPDNFPAIEDNQMWKGTFEEYMELYKTASLHLKAKFPYIKIGGYGCSGFYMIIKNNAVPVEAKISFRREYYIECFHKFMKFCQENKLPLDFFSWHSYSDVDKNIIYQDYVKRELCKYGYGDSEIFLNEWNPGVDKRGTLEDSANIAEMMMRMHDTTIDMLMYYDGQLNGSYQGLFNPIKYEPFKAYYSFRAFNQLYRLGTRVEVKDVPECVSCLAATDGEFYGVLITNKGDTREIILETDRECGFTVYRLNEDKNLEKDGQFCGNLKIEKFETVLLISKQM